MRRQGSKLQLGTGNQRRKPLRVRGPAEKRSRPRHQQDTDGRR